MTAMDQKRILTVQDISCVGKCSTTVALPVLAACGHEVSILPTTILSTHTGISSKPAVCHLDASLGAFRSHWEALDIRFDIILTGYLGSVRAVEEVSAVCRTMLAPDGELIVDPAMADHGKLYSGLDGRYASAMSQLCDVADILLPNVTEAAILSGKDYRQLEEGYVSELLSGLRCPRVVLTGVGYAPGSTGAEIRDGDSRYAYRHRRYDRNYHGTGDIFAACFAGARANGRTLYDSARIAADFTALAIEHTWNTTPGTGSVTFEPCLWKLHDMINQDPET